MQIIPVILTGGFGKRLWPLSRQTYPKQFLSLTSEKSMLQETLMRLGKIKSLDLKDPVIICNQEHRFLIAEQAKDINLDYEAILLEPIGRNTAPAVAAVCHYIHKKSEEDEEMVLVLPADHRIGNVGVFDQALYTAYLAACHGDLITFGIEPSEPHTGYGYIKKGAPCSEVKLHKVEEFIEKPDIKTAEKFFESHNYLWNSGMFMFKTSAYLEALKIFSPKIFDTTKLSVEKLSEDFDFIRLDKKEFSKSPSDSIDYAVMEKAISEGIDINVVSLEADWSDLGSWESLWEKSVRDDNANVIKGDVVSEDTHSSYLYSEFGLLTTVGIKDTIVIQTSDAVLVADKKKSEDVSKIVDSLINNKREEPTFHRKVSRPWGTFDSIDESDHFKVKRLVVYPGAKLSVQMHHRREEFWVVVTGIAKVTRGEEVLTLGQGDTVHIPVRMKHALENPGDSLLEVIEVQIGDYLGEDDIVRFDDRYGRAEKA